MAEEKKREISRRGFLAGAGALAGLAAFGLEACSKPKPTPAPLEIAPLPTRAVDFVCACCGEAFATQEALEEHIADDHHRPLPPITRVEQPTYAQSVVGEVDRFDQRNTAFSRAVWDEDYQNLIRAASEASGGKYLEQQELELRALVAGSIYTDRAAGSLVPGYRGYSGHVQDAAGLYGWDDPVSEAQLRVSDPASMSKRVKEVARFYGADLVGICRLDSRWVYSGYYDRETGESGPLDIAYKYAIVMAIEMHREEIERSPRLEASAATALAYSRMAELAPKLAMYIRALGYPAVPSGNDTAQSIPLAVDAGLGELGRNGLLITPQFGPRQRLCKVLTDLPLETDKPIDFGMQKYCGQCLTCAYNCPAGAIQRGPRTTETTSICNRTGLLRWPVDTARCYLFWQENGCDCSNCVASCPWGKAVRRWL